MEEEKQLAGEDRLSGEIVEVYRQPLPGEVVERYSRPLPGRPAAPGQPRRRRRTGLWIFLACLAVVLGVAAGSWIWYLLPAGSSADPFEYRYDHGWEEEEDASGAVTIPTYPFGEGAVLEVTPGSAADLAGIREGDFVLAAGGRPVETSQELLRIRRQLYVGDQVTMEIWRDGERMEVTLTLNDPVE